MTRDVSVRRGEPGDADAVAAFTRDTWTDRGASDYLPRVFPEWVESDDPGQHTLVAEVDGEIAGVVQAVLLSADEAWGQGLRVHPDYRGRGVSMAMTERAFEWAREQGAAAFRIMVFSWNVMGLGQSRAAGYEPVAEFRWAHPDPDSDADPGLAVTDDVGSGWQFWLGSDARTALSGLALDPGESWALSALTRERLAGAADDGGLLVVRDGGTRGLAYRTRTYEREGDDGETRTHAEYGVGAWADADACRALLRGVARDAASVGADRTRVLVPETPEAVSDAAHARVEVSDEPEFVMEADLTAPFPRRDRG